jgi:hypothetical protein
MDQSLPQTESARDVELDFGIPIRAWAKSAKLLSFGFESMSEIGVRPLKSRAQTSKPHLISPTFQKGIPTNLGPMSPSCSRSLSIISISSIENPIVSKKTGRSIPRINL